MKLAQILPIFFFIQGNVYSNKEKCYCTEQRDSIMVEKGGSVVIPCHFSFPKNVNPNEVKVYWRHAKEGRCARNEFIYNHTENYTHKDYAGRISMEGNTEKEKKVKLKITSLKKKDGPMFCCRIQLRYNGTKNEEWQNPHGTYIRFKDEFFVEQPDVVPSVIGERISIPCAIHNKSFDDIQEIIWRRGTSDLCYENAVFVRWTRENISQKGGQWTIQKSEKSFLLHMENVRDSDIGQYCCEVIIGRLRSDKSSSAHGTQVVIADSPRNNPGFITQSGTISANEGDNVIIGCSYTVPPDKNLLWSGVFWRVGSPTGPYAYHPSDLMVHPSYYRRTQLSGFAHLQIRGVQDTDNTTYYCFVMLKFCIGNNKTESTLQYGTGTQLNVKNKTLAVILAGVGVLFFLIVLCVVLIILKKKGVICKKKESVKPSPAPMGNAPMAPSNHTNNNVELSNITSSDTAVSQEDLGGPVYAHLNMDALQAGKKNKENPSSLDSHVLYAAVKPMSSDQVIYSALH